MSPTSYQAAPPRAKDITRLDAVLQPHPRQVPDKCQNSGTLTLKLLRVFSPYVRVDVESVDMLPCPRILYITATGTQREAAALRTYAGTCADARP